MSNDIHSKRFRALDLRITAPSTSHINNVPSILEHPVLMWRYMGLTFSVRFRTLDFRITVLMWPDSVVVQTYREQHRMHRWLRNSCLVVEENWLNFNDQYKTLRQNAPKNAQSHFLALKAVTSTTNFLSVRLTCTFRIHAD